MKVRVISLTRTPERRAEFQRRNVGLDYEFFDAIDGSAITPEGLAAIGLFKEVKYTAGGHGVALSHYHLWEEAGSGNSPMIVAEDDAVFRPDFAAMQAELLAELPPNWDFVLWGFNFDAALSFWLAFGMKTFVAFDATATRRAVEALKASRGRPQLMRLEFSFGLPAYTISPAGARRFRSALFPMREFSRTLPLTPNPVRNFGIDAAINQVYLVANAYVCFPPLVVTPNDRANSTVQAQSTRP